MSWTFDVLKEEDRVLLESVLGDDLEPDLTITANGAPYLYRWYLIPQNMVGANIYLHLQVADDDKQGLHDHPWDNQSVILSGGYREFMAIPTEPYDTWSSIRHPGDVIHRRAETPHRLELLSEVPYSISLFTTGPVKRDWGFWLPEGWFPHERVIKIINGVTHRVKV